MTYPMAGTEILGYGPVTRAMLVADQEAVRRACAGSWQRETAIMAATGLGRGRVRRACQLALLARRLESKMVWLAHHNYPVYAWTAIRVGVPK